jgi:hypothetical protein
MTSAAPEATGNPASRRVRWVGEDAWPSPRTVPRFLFPGRDGVLATQPGPPGSELHLGSELSGADSGAWCPYGESTDFPPDQRAEDGLALSFTTQPLSRRLEVLGSPEAILDLTVDRPLALVAVRLCDVAADGRSLLVSRGLLNLTHRHSHAEPCPMQVGEPTSVRVGLDLTGHAFAPGHRIRLAVSSTYWPFAWPSPQPVQLSLHLGDGTRLELPLREPPASGETLPLFGAPERAAAPRGEVRHVPWRSVKRELASGRIQLDVGLEERTRLDEENLEFGEVVGRRYTIFDGDPLSARVDWDGEHFLKRGSWRISVRTRTTMSATSDAFLITKDLDAFEGNVCVHSTRKSITIPRDQV